MPEDIKFTIRQMHYEDIKTCLEIWRDIGLNEGYQTALSSFKADPEGFYVAVKDDSNEIMGMCAGCMAGPNTAFMGFYAVRRQYQKQGIGKKLWSQTLKRLIESNVNIGLYGVDDMYQKYRSSGFEIDDPSRLCILECDKELSGNKLDNLKSSLEGYRLEEFNHSCTEEQFKRLVEYDREVLHYSREKLLRLYLKVEDAPLTLLAIKEGGGVTIGNRKLSTSPCCKAIAIPEEENLTSWPGKAFSSEVDRNNNEEITEGSSSSAQEPDTNSDIIAGYGCIRAEYAGGCMIGPVYADSSEIAEIIIKNLIDRYSLPLTNSMLLMCFSINKQALKIASKAGFHEAEQCGRLFTKFIPSASFSKIYYVHSPNFTLF